MSKLLGTLLLLSLLFISVNLQQAEEEHVNHTQHHKTHHRRKTILCINGKVVDGVCQCNLDFVGRHCEKQKHCESYRRFRNGSCPRCQKGYTGDFCEEIKCEHGTPNTHFTECDCDMPYSGKHCDDLETNKIYSYYNKKAFLLGPLGAISLIPMCLLYIGCEHFARKRQIKRVGEMMEDQNVNVHNGVLEYLLKDV